MLTNDQLKIVASQKLPNLRIVTMTDVADGIDILVSNDEYGHYRLFQTGKVRQFDSTSGNFVCINKLSKHIEKEIENLYPNVMAMNTQVQINLKVEINQSTFNVLSLDFPCKNCGLQELKDSTPVKDVIKCSLCGQHYTILESQEGDFGESVYTLRRSSEKELMSALNLTREKTFNCVEWIERIK